jgi:carboxypeptidase Taq
MSCRQPWASSGTVSPRSRCSYTRVVPGFIRVDADECTYPAHILLRYRLERALMAPPGQWMSCRQPWASSGTVSPRSRCRPSSKAPGRYLRPGLARGDFAPLVGWLRTHVHAKGSAAGTQEIK